MNQRGGIRGMNSVNELCSLYILFIFATTKKNKKTKNKSGVASKIDSEGIASQGLTAVHSTPNSTVSLSNSHTSIEVLLVVTTTTLAGYLVSSRQSYSLNHPAWL